VVVLERGRAYPPGSFARNPHEMSHAFWEPKDELFGLFDIRSFRKVESIVSAGLGGGSLIYANVLLRKDEKWFVHESPVPGGGYESWPLSRADLDPHYDRVEQMLGATRYPYPDTTPKTAALRDSAARLGLDWQLPPLAVSFAGRPAEPAVPGAPIPAPAFGNLHGRPRSTCRLCGECDIGCNDGAKNTLDHTYLSAAAHHGADLRTRCEVRGIAPVPGGGYEVRYVVHDPADEGHKTATRR
jgi:cholesterol oxidase